MPHVYFTPAKPLLAGLTLARIAVCVQAFDDATRQLTKPLLAVSSCLQAFDDGVTPEEIHEYTKIDPWFIAQVGCSAVGVHGGSTVW